MTRTGPPRADLRGDAATGLGEADAEDATDVDLGAVLDELPAMVGYWGPDLRNIFANRVYVEFFGLTPEQIRGRHIRDLLGEPLYELNRPYLQRALAGEPQLFEREIVDPAGGKRFTQASYIPRVVEGTVAGIVVLVTDITARRDAEEALAVAEARFRLAFAGSPVGMGLIDDSGRLIQVNAALCEMLDFEETELLDRGMADLVIPDTQRDERERIARLFSGHPEAASVERQLVRKDGSTLWVILSIALAGDARKPLGIGHVQDISKRKEAEDELRRSRARLNEAEKIARIGSWEWDLTADRISWSDGLYEIYGLTPEEFVPTREAGEQRVYAEDRPLVRQTVERALAERSGFTLEYRAVRSDGRLRTLRNRAEVVVDESGEPIRVVGIAEDITDARLTKELLVNASEELERRALELRRQASGRDEGAPAGAQAPLTPRQLEIMQLVAQGLTNAAIAERLFITEGTVKWHIKQILAKTASSNRAEAVARVLGTPG